MLGIVLLCAVLVHAEPSFVADFVVVGAGNAGCAIAARLAENRSVSVVLLEEGAPEAFLDDQVVPFPRKTFLTWDAGALTQTHFSLPNQNGYRDTVMAGRGFGGTTRINGGFAAQPTRAFFDGWNIPGWGGEDMGPFIETVQKRFEYQMQKGRRQSVLNDLQAAGTEAGWADPPMDAPERLLDHGRRVTSFGAYLMPMVPRENLQIFTSAEVVHVEVQEGVAQGVWFLKDSKLHFVRSTREVVLSAGVWGTPKILQQSGIGPCDVLQKLGIQPVVDLPVGKSLIARPMFGMFSNYSKSIPEMDADNVFSTASFDEFYEHGTGPLTGSVSAVYEAIQTQHDQTSPGGSSPDAIFEVASFTPSSTEAQPQLLFLCMPGMVRTLSQVDLESTSTNRLRINLTFYEDPGNEELAAVRRCVRHVRDLTSTSAFQQVSEGGISDTSGSPLPTEDHILEEVIRNNSLFSQHAFGSARMGMDAQHSVVDQSLKVHGIARLRVADASVFPASTPSGPMMAVYVLAEKAVALLQASAMPPSSDSEHITPTRPSTEQIEQQIILEPDAFADDFQLPPVGYAMFSLLVGGAIVRFVLNCMSSRRTRKVGQFVQSLSPRAQSNPSSPALSLSPSALQQRMVALRRTSSGSVHTEESSPISSPFDTPLGGSPAQRPLLRRTKSAQALEFLLQHESWLDVWLEKKFRQLGRLCAAHPIRTIFATMLPIACLVPGLIWLTWWTDLLAWVDPESKAMHNHELINEHFGKSPRAFSFMARAKTMDNGGILDPGHLAVLMAIHWRLTNITVSFKGVDYGLKDICHREFPGASACQVASILKFWDFSVLKLQQDKSPPETIGGSDNPELNFLSKFLLGGVTWTSDREQLVSASSTMMFYSLRNDGDFIFSKEVASDTDRIVQMWESEALSIVTETARTAPDIELLTLTSRTMQEAIVENASKDAVLVGVQFVAMLLYLSSTLGEFMSWSNSRRFLAITVVFEVVLACLAAGGACGYVGLWFSDLTGLAIVVLLAAGVDDAFVIMSAFEQTDKELPSKERVARALGVAGPSILVTSLTNTVAFAFGALSRFPVIRHLCIPLSIGFFVDFALQVTQFIAFLALDEARRERNRVDLFCCFPAPRNPCAFPPIASRLSARVMRCLTKALGSIWFQLFILAVFFSSLSVSTIALANFDVENDFDFYFDPDSVVHKFVIEKAKSYAADSSFQVVVTGGNFHDETVRAELERVRKELLRIDGVTVRPALSWLQLFQLWGWSRVLQGRKQSLPFTEEAFYTDLHEFLEDAEHSKPVRSDLVFQSNKNNVCSAGTVGQGRPIMSRMHFARRTQPDQRRSVRANDEIRKIVNDSPLPLTLHSDMLMAEIVMTTLKSELLITILFSTCSVLVVVYILLSSLRLTAIIGFLLVSGYVQILGFMRAVGIAFNPMVSFYLFTSVGLSVDAMVHIAHAFILEPKRRTLQERIQNAVSIRGHALLRAALSSMIGVSVLTFSQTQLFFGYFAVFVVIIIIGTVHGLVVLPVLIRLFGKASNDQESEGPSTPTAFSNQAKLTPISTPKAANVQSDVTSEVPRDQATFVDVMFAIPGSTQDVPPKDDDKFDGVGPEPSDPSRATIVDAPVAKLQVRERRPAAASLSVLTRSELHKTEAKPLSLAQKITSRPNTKLVLFRLLFFVVLGFVCSLFFIGEEPVELELFRASVCDPDLSQYPSKNGYCNARNYPSLGRAGDPFDRQFPASLTFHANNQTYTPHPGPNPRALSNAFFKFKPTKPNPFNQTAILTGLIQFFLHDVLFSKDDYSSPPINISVPPGDSTFDPEGRGDAVLKVWRNVAKCRAPNECTDEAPAVVNYVTHWHDGSGIYGSSEEVNRVLRSFSGGKLRMGEDNMLPFNDRPDVIQMIGHGPQSELYLAGDERANSNVFLLAFHTLMAREHNRICSVLSQQYPDWNDEKLFNVARLTVVLEFRQIASEYVASYGLDVVQLVDEMIEADPFALAYNADNKPRRMSEEFSMIYRWHSLIPENAAVADDCNRVVSETPLSHLHYNTTFLKEQGLGRVLAGMASTPIPTFGAGIIDALRNHRFSGLADPRHGNGFDMAAWEIVRSRQRGIPRVNEYRRDSGLKPFTSFEEMSADPEIVTKLRSLYESPEDVEWIVYLEIDEARYRDTAIPTSAIPVLLDIVKILISDRFSLSLANQDTGAATNDLPVAELERIRNLKLSDVIRLNTDQKCLQPNVFRLPEDIENRGFNMADCQAQCT